MQLTPANGSQTVATQDGTLVRFRSVSLVLLVMSFTSLALFFAWRAAADQRELSRLREQNLILNAHLKELDTSFANIRKYTRSVRALTGAEQSLSQRAQADPTFDIVSKTFEASGVLGNLNFATMAAAFQEAEDAATRRSDITVFTDSILTIDGIGRESATVLRRLKALATILRHNESLTNGIPSLMPAKGRITSEFGTRLSPFGGGKAPHVGIDIAAKVGTKVRAPADGIVTYAADFDTLGYTIVVEHSSGIVTRYGHLQSMNVSVGQTIKRGQRIATVGNSGRSTGPHLHYEVWVKGEAVNPRDFFFDLAETPRNPHRAASAGQSDRTMVAGDLPLKHVETTREAH